MSRKNRIIQLTSDAYNLYALDARGRVWSLGDRGSWRQLESLPDEPPITETEMDECYDRAVRILRIRKSDERPARYDFQETAIQEGWSDEQFATWADKKEWFTVKRTPRPIPGP